MEIRRANYSDIPLLVELDRMSFGEYGADEEYFTRKLEEFSEGLLVGIGENRLFGVIIFEVKERDDIPGEYRNLVLYKSFAGRWMYIPVFTTEGNYKDKVRDSELLGVAERSARNKGCVEAAVFPSKEHPYKENAFKFWEMNGYENVGEISWIADSNQFVDRFVYRKKLV